LLLGATELLNALFRHEILADVRCSPLGLIAARTPSLLSNGSLVVLVSTAWFQKLARGGETAL